MNITFLIGNGFDLRLGMKTRFSDMYGGYIEQPSASDTIFRFKETLKADAPEYKTWGDFEMAMALKAKDFDEEIEFIECVRDFKLYMEGYLIQEQEKWIQRLSVSQNTTALCANELLDSIVHFYTGFTPNTVNEILPAEKNLDLNYNFISFNYTNIFDTLLNFNSMFTNRTEIVHIHGKLGADIVLGIDNLGQVGDLPYETTNKFKRAFIKPEFNKSYDNLRIAIAEATIDNSDIICVYGMSFGKSDYSWVSRLKNWLLSNADHHLVYFVRNKKQFSKSNWDAIMDEEEDSIASLLGKMCDSGDEMGKIFAQIHIPISYDIFNVDEILKTETIRTNELNRQKSELKKRLREAMQ